MPELNRTPLYDRHVALGGRMVPFAGYELPVQYPTGPLAEHHAVRTAAGLFDIDHMGQFRVTGVHAGAFLQYVQPRDLDQMQVWDAEYSFLCYGDGTFVDDIFVYRLPDAWFVVVNAANREKDLFWLDTHAAGFEVEILDESDTTCMLALQGPKAQSILQKLTGYDLDTLGFHKAARIEVADIETLVGATGYTGEYGYEMFFGAEHAVAMWESLIEAGERRRHVALWVGGARFAPVSKHACPCMGMRSQPSWSR